jgi:hypothetical protein
MKSENPNHLEHSGPVQACNGIALPLPDMDSFTSDCHYNTEEEKIEFSLSTPRK